MKAKLTPWKPEDNLKTRDAQAEFLLAALEENDPAFLADSLAVVARANGAETLAIIWDGFAAALKAFPPASKAERRRTKAAARSK